ncbi:MAG: ATP-binding protein, partial [Fimbriiglobus sp.]
FGDYPPQVAHLFHHPTVRCWHGEMRLDDQTNKSLILESRWTCVADEAGREQSILAVLTDITEKKQLEMQFLRSQRLEVVGTMASGIAHDLNNILTPLVVATPMLQQYLDDPEGRDLLKAIESSAERASNVLKQILEFGRGQRPSRIAMNVADLFGDQLAIIRETFPRNIHIEQRIAPGTPPVQGDPTHLQQILMNLCVNARDSMPKGGRLLLTAQPFTADLPYGLNCKAVRIEVKDTGIGIPPGNLVKIFDPFFTTKDIGVGTGLGLATVQSLVQKHGGIIMVESTVGLGTTFRIDLPASTATETPMPGTVTISTPAPRVRKLPDVLVVDDDDAIRAVVQALLSQQGYSVLGAMSPAQALSLCQDESLQISFVLADLMMPGVHELELVQAIRKLLPNAEIIVMSGTMQTELENRLRSIGVDHVLPKPFSPQRLFSIMQTALSESSKEYEIPEGFKLT